MSKEEGKEQQGEGSAAVTSSSTSSSAAAPFTFSSPNFSFDSSSAASTSAATSTPFIFDLSVPLFTVGAAPPKADDDDENNDDGDDSNSKRRSSRNPFHSDSRSRPSRHQQDDTHEEEGEAEGDEEGQAQDEEEEDGEDEEGEDDEDDGEDDEPELDSDDEGDTPYPEYEEGPGTVACEQCGSFWPKHDLANHERNICAETPMECPYAGYQCGATATNRRLLRTHINRNIEDHIVWIFQELESQRSTIKALNESLAQETTYRKELEREVERLTGKKVQVRSSGTPRRGILSSSGMRRGGSVSFSPLPTSHHTHGSGSTHVEAGGFRVSFDVDTSKPLERSANRWVPHSLATSHDTPSKKPSGTAHPLMGTGNVASEEQTRLKVAAGLLPTSALDKFKTPSKDGASTSTSTSTSTPQAQANHEDVESIKKKLKSVLNKLSAQNYEKLSKQVLEIMRSAQTDSTFASLMVCFFDKAVVDPFFANLYANLCNMLSKELPPLPQGNGNGNGNASNNTFRRFLLNQCQAEFQAENKPIQPTTPDEDPDVVATRRYKQKQRMLGTIRFIGELFRKDLILINIMSYCISHLLPHLQWSKVTDAASAAAAASTAASSSSSDAIATPSSSSPFSSSRGELPPFEQEASDSIEAFCKLLATIGPKFEAHPTGKDMLDAQVWPAIRTASKEKSMPARLRFMLQDLDELRTKHHWIQREAAQATQPMTAVEAEELTVSTGKTVPSGSGAVSNSSTHTTPSRSGGGRGMVHTSDRPPAPPPSSGGRGAVSSARRESEMGSFTITFSPSRDDDREDRRISSGGSSRRNPMGPGNAAGRGETQRSDGGGGRGNRSRAHPLDSRYEEDDDRGRADDGRWVRGDLLERDDHRPRRSGGGGGGGGRRRR